jgi:ribose 5-phosphate isomerase B
MSAANGIKIAVGADHRGSDMLSQLVLQLEQEGWAVMPMTCNEQRSCDYPDMAWPVARAVADGEADRGILICGSGIGMCIAANKVAGIRAALVHDELGAEISRRHNDANIVCLAADLLGQRIIERIVTTWLNTEFEAGRHARRNRKIEAIENGQDPGTVTPEQAQAPVSE